MKNNEECCWLDDIFEKCSLKTVKNSFFCKKHKPLLFKTEDFVLVHSGNKKKILEDMKIKTAESLGIPGFAKLKLNQVFFQLSFPGRKLDNIQYGGSSMYTQIKKGEEGDLFIDIKILDKLSKLNKNIHFSNVFSVGFFTKDSIKWDSEYSIKENINRIYYFILKNNYDSEIKIWKTEMIEKISFEKIKKKIFDFESSYSNEFVISGDVPLIIGKKNYIL